MALNGDDRIYRVMRQIVYIAGGTVQIVAIVALMVFGPSAKTFAALVNPDDSDSTTIELGSSGHIAKRVDPLFNPLAISPLGATGEVSHFFLLSTHLSIANPVGAVHAYSSIIRGPPGMGA